MTSLIEITDDHAIVCAKIAGITGDYEIERFGGLDNGSILIRGICKGKQRSIRIYFNGSNTRCLQNGFEVVEFCFRIYDYLRSVGYNVNPHGQG